MDKKLVALLEDIALFLELKGENPFKTRAFSNVARILETQNIDVAEAVQTGEIASIQGIGKGLQEIIGEYVRTGSIVLHTELRAEIPAGLVEMSKLKGLGAKKIIAIHEQLGITEIGELEYACKENRLAELKGFGAKTQEQLLRQIELWQASQGHFHLHKASADAQELMEIARSFSAVEYVEISGEMRRSNETVQGIDLLACVRSEYPDAREIEQKFSASTVPNREPHRASFPSSYGIPTTLTFVQRKYFARELLLSTGSPEFISALNLLLPSDANAESEAELFALAGLPFIPPELRDDADILDLARRGELPELVQENAMRGMFHIHTTWSDGANSLREMALGAKERGYTHIAICDHSQSAAYAGGLKPEKVAQQHEEIEAFNAENLGIRILKGIESDILGDGSLDYPDEILAKFDLVVASVHSRFTMDETAMTERIINAVRNPFTTMLGHPTGRLLLARKEYAVNMQAVIDAAADAGKIIEINANPYRLDLSWKNVRYAKSKGVKMAVNPDAHRVEDLQYMRFGTGIARKGMLTNADVVNTLPLADFLTLIGKKLG